MTLTSGSFFLFAVLTAAVYFALYKNRLQRYVLLAAAFVLLIGMSQSPAAAVLVLLWGLLIWGIGLRLETAAASDRKRTADLLLALGLLADLGLLCWFKFFGFTWTLLQETLEKTGLHLWDLAFPLGLSYYSLSAAAYLLDIRHRKHPAEKNPADLLLFLTYFPSLAEGPINLYRGLMPQLKANHGLDWKRLEEGVFRILVGYFKKMVIADRIGIAVTAGLADETLTGFSLFWIMVLYSFQIYADFSGGIDVMMGISHMFGIELKENFNAPFVAHTVTEFWQRWHRTLGDWMEKYVYYPLVLNKKLQKLSRGIRSKYFRSVCLTAFASFVVFVLVGIWHGTGWNYVVYGCYQAFFVAGAAFLGPLYKKIRKKLMIREQGLLWRMFTALRTFVILVFGRVLSRAGSLGQAGELYRRIFSRGSLGQLWRSGFAEYGLDRANVLLMYGLMLLLLAGDILREKVPAAGRRLSELSLPAKTALALLLLTAILLFGIYGPGYDAAAFIYQQF